VVLGEVADVSFGQEAPPLSRRLDHKSGTMCALSLLCGVRLALFFSAFDHNIRIEEKHLFLAYLMLMTTYRHYIILCPNLTPWNGLNGRE